ncbi:hypothetical protein [Succinimonas sp.]|uniref:hypothetical protein n=1 Tax=Succinimonas sp. TaxID=1936151 RepID=UPI0038652485
MLYYERLLVIKEKSSVIAEEYDLMETLAAENFNKDPYVPDFHDLKNYQALRESDLEPVRQVKSIGSNDSGITLVMDGVLSLKICQP